MSLSRAEILERERRGALPASLASIAAVVLVFGSLVLVANRFGADGEAEFLRKVDGDTGMFLFAQCLKGAGSALLALPLAFLFRAALARSESMRGQLIGITIAGPLFLGASAMFSALAVQDAASDFVARDIAGSGARADELAEDLIRESPLQDLASGLGLGGVLGFAVAMAYTSLHAMRTGLLTRFWGSLGVALGAVSFLFFQFALLWFLYLGLLFSGRVPGGRPSAWEAGEAVPWPAPGEQPDESPAEAEQGELHPGTPGGEAEDVPGNDSSPARRKRKRRR